jgi:RNA-directed DNA polymerase
VLVQALIKKMDDKRFINLINAMLKAGYMEDWRHHPTYSGTPQGGVCTPLTKLQAFFFGICFS